MASVETITPYHLLQPSFATGEISKEIANRVDLDKYQAALTKAENCLIRPYGPVYKRPGTEYVANCKNNNSKCILQSFTGRNNIDYLLEFGVGYVRIYKQGVYKAEVATPYGETTLNKLRFTQSADVMFIASGDYPVKTLTCYSDTSWAFGEYGIDKPYFDDSLGGGTENCTIAPSGISGNVILTSNEDIFFSGLVGVYVRLKQSVQSTYIELDNVGETSGTSSSVYCGESWKITTHGTWGGHIFIEYSDDNSNWREYRSYNSKRDYNATESGSLSEGKYLRIRYDLWYSDNNNNFRLTVLPYTQEGYVKVTSYIDARHIGANVVEKLGNTDATKQWSFSAWCSAYGYPKTVAFFQDRFCLGGNNNQPYMLWMSRTGDYTNFSVEKASGNVTDDSAVALSFVSRKQFEIKHLVPNTDLIILTKGNEWILSGSEVITPSSATPKMQTTRGCGNVEPIMIGSKTVFVQGRGSVVRDMGYSYETDSYGGVDLTLLDKPIVRGYEIIDATYMQEPNSAIYFVREDGTIVVLTYVIDQKVYAWSTFKTDGVGFESICAIAEGDEDVIYVVANRNNKRYLEKFDNDRDSYEPNDYVMLDCATKVGNGTPQDSFTVSQLAGRYVDVLGDGRAFQGIQVNNSGVLKLPTKIKYGIVGLPYTMKIELPNVEIKGKDGTMQGRFKTVSEVILRLDNTLGGSVGPNADVLDDIHYDEFQDYSGIVLYSGDKKMQVPIGGFNTDGRVYIESSTPYPFNLLAVVRVVSLGG